MTTRRIPLRKCSGCGEMKSKKELIRVIRTPEETIEVDLTGKKNGRGAYLCNSMDCFRQARKTRALERSLNMTIPEEVLNRLEEEMIQSHEQ